MSDSERPLRADAERNRQRLLEAAAEMFAERGLEVGVAEIAQRAGIGRGTLFRNFPTKEHLVAAVVVERMRQGSEYGRRLLEAEDAGEALFRFLEEFLGRQQVDRAVFEAVADTFLANPEIRAAHTEVVGVLEALLQRAQREGSVRDDVGAMDVLILMKGICQSASAFSHIDPRIGERYIDLIRAALLVPAGAQKLRGRMPTLDDLEVSLTPSADVADPRARRATG